MSTTEQTVLIHVVDDGPGIEPADWERVFERFVRVDPSRNRSSGNSGLGLAIVRDIAAAHHGRVWFTENAGAGAHLVIELLRVVPPTAPDDVESPVSTQLS